MTVRARSIVVTVVCLGLLLAPLAFGARAGHLPEAVRGIPQTGAFMLVGTLAWLTSPRHRGARRLLLVGLVMGVGYLVGSICSSVVLGGGRLSWQVVLLLQALEMAQGWPS